ncbi:MAG: DNA double-strand break repair nuclease NurA, partial [Chloroflexota bacterium]
MTLDLAAVSRQMGELGSVLRDRQQSEGDRLRLALQLLGGLTDHQGLAAKITSSHTAWRCAVPVETPSLRRPAPSAPAELSVLASDGSTIEPDRHGSALCYLINIGLVALHYGSRPCAELHSDPHLGYRDDDLYVTTGEQQVLMSGPLLSIRRQTLEGERLVELAEGTAAGRRAVALQDGTLMLGTLEGSGLEQWLRDKALPSLLAQYERMLKHNLPLGAYMSRPRHGEVVNALRVLACPLPLADCQHGCTADAPDDRPGRDLCHALAHLSDRGLFARTLAAGERSAIFRSQWPISLKFYGAHRIHFFYLNVGPE